MTMTAPQNDWNDCPPGEITGVVRTLRKRQQRKTMQQAAAMTLGLVLLAIGVGGVVSGQFRGNAPTAEIACDRVQELAPLYVSHRLEAGLTAQIGQHLKDCKHCRQHYHQQFPEFSLSQRGTTTRPPNHASVLAEIRYQSDR